MSLDLFLFTDNSSIPTIESLEQEFLRLNLHLRVLRDFRSWDEYTVCDSGSLMDNDDIFAAPDHRAGRAAIRTIDNGGGKRIEQHKRDEYLGSCILDRSVISMDDRMELIEQFQSNYGQEPAEYMRRVQIKYNAECKSWLTSVFTSYVTVATLARLLGGLYEDPQTGDSGIIKRGESPPTFPKPESYKTAFAPPPPLWKFW